MNRLEPIYTEKTQCQDCYKCVRRCPVKAIRIKENSATVVPELCILCGKCVNVCPVQAKRIREDLDRAKRMVSSGKKVIASLAPSFITEFGHIEPEQLVRALKEVGFYGVSETSLGAEIVSSGTAELLRNGDKNIYISSACPSTVDLIRKYYPEYSQYISPLLSPVLAHCRMLRKIYGDDIGIVFFNPCVAKKREADNYSDLLDAALTFRELRMWLDECGVKPERYKVGEDDGFIPRQSYDGALYPVEGGMNEGVRKLKVPNDVHFLSFSGVEVVESALQGLNPDRVKGKLFIELLACSGGCVNGPRATHRSDTIGKMVDVYGYARNRDEVIESEDLDITAAFPAEPVKTIIHDEEEIMGALRSIGKMTEKDELNCGGCGYDSCRLFAQAYIEGKAEAVMCVSYMRKLAMNKANALIKAMPSGVVIVDENLNIVECNMRFAEIIGGDVLAVFDAFPGLEGASLRKSVPFHEIFSDFLKHGNEKVMEKKIRMEDKIIHLTIFPIEKSRIVGGIIQDITLPAVEREQIINKAQDVIKKNLTTVQQIAYLLGENAAETEVILNSIIESFSPAPTDRGNEI